MELLEKLTAAVSPSGWESAVRDCIIEELKDCVDELTTDAMGNLIAHKKGTGKRILLSAHMDSIGVIVTFVDDKGFLRFAPIGWLPQFYALYRKVRFANGVTGVIAYEESLEELKELKADKLYIDIGASSKEEAETMVSVGEAGTLTGSFSLLGAHRVSGPYLDNRAGCWCLIQAAKRSKATQNDVYYVFSVQEEVGLRGAKTAAFAIGPDYALAIDTTDTGDTPNCKPMALSLGKGPAVKVMDRSVIAAPSVKDSLIALAKEKNIPYQLEIMTDGGTDAGAMQQSQSGVLTGGIAIPTRYIHSSVETVDRRDLEGAADLAAAFILQ